MGRRICSTRRGRLGGNLCRLFFMAAVIAITAVFLFQSVSMAGEKLMIGHGDSAVSMALSSTTAFSSNGSSDNRYSFFPLFEESMDAPLDRFQLSNGFWKNFHLSIMPDYSPAHFQGTDRFYLGSTGEDNGFDFLPGPESDPYGFSLGAEYRLNAMGLSFGPYAKANFFKIRFDKNAKDLGIGYGIPGFDLPKELRGKEVTSFSTSLGGHAAYAIRTSLAVLIPYMRFEWEHQFENDPRQVEGISADGANFGENDNLDIIYFPSDDPDRDFFNLGMGFSAFFPYGVSAFVDYETIIGLEEINGLRISTGFQFQF